MPIQVSLRTVHKEIYKKRRNVCFSMLSFRSRQFNFEPQPHWSPFGV